MEIERLIAICKSYHYGYRIVGENPQILLVGEGHNVAYRKVQEEIIQIIKPKIILHEGADADLSRKEDLDMILGWETKYQTKVELCDIPNSNPEQHALSKQALKEKIGNILSEFGFAGKYELYLSMINPLREAVMTSKILSHYENQNLPILSIVGTKHVLPESLVHFLESKKLSYMTIAQQPEALQNQVFYGTFFEHSQ